MTYTETVPAEMHLYQEESKGTKCGSCIPWAHIRQGNQGKRADQHG
jgi:hypothetical protein